MLFCFKKGECWHFHMLDIVHLNNNLTDSGIAVKGAETEFLRVFPTPKGPDFKIFITLKIRQH